MEVNLNDIGDIQFTEGSIIMTITVLSPEVLEKLKQLVLDHKPLAEDFSGTELVPIELPPPIEFDIQYLEYFKHEYTPGMFGIATLIENFF
jgi:hypothetical protein